MASKALSNLIVACMLAAPLSAQSVGEFAPLSVGLQVDYNRAMSPDSVPIQSTATGAPLGKQLDTLYGAALVGQVRLGEVINWKMRAFTLQVNLGARYGSDKENGVLPTFNTVLGQTPVILAPASYVRKTKVTETYVSLPLRWYTNGGAIAVEGFFIEGGPGWSRTQQTVDLTVSGDVSGSPVSLPDSVKYSQTKMTWQFGAGLSKVMRSSIFTYGVSYQKVVDAGTFGSSFARVYLTWNF